MPANLDFTMYFNITFLSILGLGMLFGFLRGMKKALYSLMVTLIFIIIFFFTLDLMVNLLYEVNMPFLGGLLGNVYPSLSSVTTLKEALPIVLEDMVGEEFQASLTNENLIEFIDALALFVIKIIYAIIYFTVIQVIYRFILFLVRIIFFSSKKDKKSSKHRLLGGLFGLMNGAVSVFVMLIILGGIINISESLLTVTSNIQEDSTVTLNFNPRDELNQPSSSIIEMAETSPIPAEFTEVINTLNEMITAYSSNIVVQSAAYATIPNTDSGTEEELTLYLFDQILSMKYKEQKIAIREELAVFADVASLALNSEYLETNNLGDITGEEIRDIFTTLSNSNLLTALLPLGIEVASDIYETEITVPVEELYEIDWENEIMILGEVAATVFDIINAAAIFEEGTDLMEVTLDGDEVEGLFTEIGQSDLVNLAAYVAIEPVLEMAGEIVQSVITVPADIVWEDEFQAISALAGEIFNTGITVGDLESGDPTVLLTTLSSMDFTVILNSQIITNALINIISGESLIAINLDYLTIPSDIVWLDVLDGDGNIISNGELRNILLAINALSTQAENLDLENFNITTIADLDADAINTIFESRILVATITNLIKTLDLGEIALVVPDSVFDEDGYILKLELQNVVSAIHMAATELLCEVGDLECEEVGFDIGKALTLSSTNIDTLLESEILSATVGKLLIDMDGEFLVIPDSVIDDILVDEVLLSVISKDEVKNAFLAVSALGITDINNIDIDPSILTNLATEADPTILDTSKTDLIFGSEIVHATLSDAIIEMTLGDNPVLEVPYIGFADEIIRYEDDTLTIEYISQAELENVIEAILVLEITDFNAIDTLDLGLIIDNSTVILESAILHSTISKQLFDLGADVISIPYLAEDGSAVRVTKGDVGEETVYLIKTELESIFDALEVLGITDINTFTGDIDLATILADENNVSILLASSTIQATVSEQLIQLDIDGTIYLPYLAEDNTTEIRKAVGSLETETVYVVKTEIDAMFKALNALGISDIESFTGTIDLSVLALEENRTKVLSSSTIQATVTKQLVDLDVAGTLELPYYSEDNQVIRVTVGSGLTETEYLTVSELDRIFVALNILGITDVNTFTGNVDLSVLAVGDNAETVLLSDVIQATVSKQVLDLDLANTVRVPYLADDDTTNIRVTVGLLDKETNYITKAELETLILALNILQITDVNTFGGTVNLALLNDPLNRSGVLASSIIQATITKQLVDLDVAGTLVAPYLAEDGTTEIRITVGSLETESEYIIKSELDKIFIALNVLGITDVNTFNGKVDLSLLNNHINRTSVLASSTIQATITNQIIDLEVTDILDVPYYSEDGVTLVRKTVGLAEQTTEYIVTSELDKIFVALNILGITDVTTFTGDVDLSVLAVGDNAETVLLSDVIQATVSKQVLDLDTANTITVPFLAEDNLTEIRITVGLLETETNYITKVELETLILALNILHITDVNTFTGTVNLALLNDPLNRSGVLASSTIQATITKQILDLDVAGTLEAPYYSEDGVTVIRKTVGLAEEANEYIIVNELDKVLVALNILGISDVTSFTGSVDLSVLSVDNNAETVLSSDVIQATVSKQVLDLDVALTIKVPHLEDDDLTVVRVTVGSLATETEYVTKVELESLIIAMNILNITDFTTYNGQIDLTLFYEVENRNKLLTSAIMQATISKQVLDLGPAILTVPAVSFDNGEIRRTVGALATTSEYILKPEIHALFEALELLGITNINDFTGSVSLNKFFASVDPNYDTNQDVLLASASMHATITKQIDDLGAAIIEIPTYSVLGNAVDVTVGSTYYIYKNEIKYLINALDILSISDINAFTGAVDLTPLFGSDTNQTVLLASSLMHKTITNQISNLGPTILTVPSIGFDGTTTIDFTILGIDYYIEGFEIKALINALEVFGITDITDFSGTIDISSLALETDQDIVLSSESMHATISKTLFDLNDQVLIVPIYSSEGELEAYRVQKQVNLVDFIYKSEIKALINAFVDMGYTDLSSFGIEINSQKFFDNPNLYLLSASIHATLSDKLINGTGGELIVPDTNINTLAIIRLIHTDVTYVEINEAKALLAALEEIGLTDFSNIDISPTNLFAETTDLDILLNSASMQATISNTLLSGAGDDTTAYGAGILIVPNYYRETIAVATISAEQIEKVELKALITGLKTVGVTDFSGTVPSSAVSSLGSTQLDTILLSGSMHVTINHMIWGNTNISSQIPDYMEGLALTDLLYNMNNIIIKAEVKAFVLAAQQFAGSDLSNVDFDVAAITSLTPVQRDIVLDSMIVRNILADELETMMTSDDPFDLYWPANSDYEQSNPAYFLTEAGINNVLTHYGLI